VKKKIYQGKVIDLSVETVTLPNGATAELELIKHPGASAVVPLKDNQTVVMIRQYRHAVGGYIYEIPAGKLHPGEDPRDCAMREVEEEIGYKVGTLEPLLSFFTTPGFTDEIIHIFIGKDLTVGKQDLGDDEVLEIVEIPLAKTIELINDGTIKDGKTIIALQATYLQFLTKP
jgi:ADP-ribose diphosphatase